MTQESNCYHISPTGTIITLPGVTEALGLLKGDGYIWLDFCHPQKEDLAVLIEPLGLHPLSIEDCFDDNQIPKVEDLPTNTFILFNAYTYSAQTLTINEVDFFIGSKFLVTVSRPEYDHQPLLRNLNRIVSQEIENVRQGPAFLAHVLLDYVVDKKFIAVEALEEELNQSEDLILADQTNFDPANLLRLRRDLMALRKSLFHEREILVKLCRKDSIFIPEKAILYYRDIYDHLAKFFELTETYRELVTSLIEMNLSILNNKMTKAANDTNITVRRLTFITTIFMPLSLLAGIGGMSEWSMMTGPENWRIAYPAFLAAMAVIGIANYVFLKWYDKRSKGRE